MYRDLLFDVDDTLLDFKAGESLSLAQTFAALKIDDTPEIESTYLRINVGLWEDYEAGRIRRNDIFTRRFATTFKQLKLNADGQQAERIYRQLLNQQAVLLPETVSVLKRLRDYDCYIVSNGIEPVQIARLTESGIIDFFNEIFVSDTVGSPKPTMAFFDYVAKRIPGFDPKRALIIGDSLTSDIQGGRNAQIDSVWFNPHFIPNRSQIFPTYQLNHLTDLLPLLETNR
ncbi:YjjG family noncanonical pyrimidine nucleotidase [Lacticaseibacillus brantae]|uniref:Hydrolase (HAD superfamily) protein n=1 Tax=Lacticaseibacillus brantae DSM 23927 TaxID=1423727 RepID=A0A0R2AX31_9LACO|nr:YjjG family noncanonical pyrimidine nucleotidase [Lacticaseibacillus brantae]KRM71568.1 hydrolase (HAD superfamily) protein [Lacticaseibacillus brantae DSM 23927]